MGLIVFHSWVHVLHVFSFMWCSCVYRHECHASRNRHNVQAENKETIAHIRVTSISLAKFSRLDGKIKVAREKADEQKVELELVRF